MKHFKENYFQTRDAGTEVGGLFLLVLGSFSNRSSIGLPALEIERCMQGLRLDRKTV